MPIRRKKPSYSRRRRISRKIYRRARKVAIRARRPRIQRWGAKKAIQTFPDAVRVKCKWVGVFNLVAGTTSVSLTTFAGASPRNPYPAVGTTHAYGYSDWISDYGRFQCDSSAISVQIIPYRTSTTGQIDPVHSIGTVVVLPSSQGTLTSYTVDELAELPYARKVNTSSLRNSYLRTYMTQKKIYGEKTSPQAFSGTSSADPTANFSWILAAQPIPGGGSVDLDLKVVVTIVYYTRFTERISIIDPL